MHGSPGSHRGPHARSRSRYLIFPALAACLVALFAVRPAPAAVAQPHLRRRLLALSQPALPPWHRPVPRAHRSAARSATLVTWRRQLGCQGLEALWVAAGGPRRAERTAADIALAESTGWWRAVSPNDDIGLWQIAASNRGQDVHGRVIRAVLAPLSNARDAIALSRRGKNWGDWSTYADGSYLRQRC
jgi:Lysozyme like domain